MNRVTSSIMTTELGPSAFGFKLPGGEILLINREDIQKIANELIVEMLVNKQNRIYLIKDVALARAKELYNVYSQEKKEMDDEMRKKYLKSILRYLDKEDFSIETFEEAMKDPNNKPLSP